MNWKYNKFVGFDYCGIVSLYMVLLVYMYVVFFLIVLDIFFE